MNYVIIGAFDGVSFDNIFEKISNNDKVVFVEPIPYYFKILKFNAQRLNCECYFENVAISNKKDTLKLAYLNIEKVNNYASFYQGCSSVIEEGSPLNIYLKDVKEEDLKIHNIEAITFDDLCYKHNLTKVDYVQVDCEGYDQKIVETIDLEKYNIQTLKFEKHYLKDDFISIFSNKWPSYKHQIVEGDVIFTKL
jgi:FkbM family methyltransferase